jgi:single-strand DNA-binding protein
MIENVEFLGSKGNNNSSNTQSIPADAFGGGNFEEEITPVDDGDMPF